MLEESCCRILLYKFEMLFALFEGCRDCCDIMEAPLKEGGSGQFEAVAQLPAVAGGCWQ